VDHHRLDGLKEILAEYAIVADEGMNTAEAEIVSARELNEQDRLELEAQVAKLVGSKFRVAYRQDASLLGGVTVRIGSTVYDGSIKGQLSKLKQSLVNA
jgi:F-type H+-transporting ATPase subunit delta